LVFEHKIKVFSKAAKQLSPAGGGRGWFFENKL